MEISVVILTKNEEANIVDCLHRLKDFSEVIIVDDLSDDRTIEVAKSLKIVNLKIFERKMEEDFSNQRNFGLNQAKGEWVLFIDSDERVSEKLTHEIKRKAEENKYDAFKIKRKDIIWGKELNYGETGNIKPIRMAKKKSGKWVGKVHEVWKVEGSVGELENTLTHIPHQSIQEFLSDINKYSTIRANELYECNTLITLWHIILYPSAKFFLTYFVKKGFLDGVQGLLVSGMMSFHSFLVRVKLWNLKKARNL